MRVENHHRFADLIEQYLLCVVYWLRHENLSIMPNYAIVPMTIFLALSQVACRPDDRLEALLRGGSHS